MSVAAGSIDQLYFVLTRITTHRYTDSMETDPYELKKASGFFYCNQKSKQFLITNRHVVINEDEKYFPNIMRIRIHTDSSDLRHNEYYDIPLARLRRIGLNQQVQLM